MSGCRAPRHPGHPPDPHGRPPHPWWAPLAARTVRQGAASMPAPPAASHAACFNGPKPTAARARWIWVLAWHGLPGHSWRLALAGAPRLQQQPQQQQGRPVTHRSHAHTQAPPPYKATTYLQKMTRCHTLHPPAPGSTPAHDAWVAGRQRVVLRDERRRPPLAQRAAPPHRHAARLHGRPKRQRVGRSQRRVPRVPPAQHSTAWRGGRAGQGTAG